MLLRLRHARGRVSAFLSHTNGKLQFVPLTVD
jgi:hypothetical protein